MNTLIAIIGFILIAGILISLVQKVNQVISKQSHIMATFSDIETGLSNLNTAITSVQTGVTALQGTSISSAEGDTILTAINAAATNLQNIVSTLTPAS